jgi:hypothetical protein
MCAGSLLTRLLEAHRAVLAPVIVDLLRSASDACPPGAAPEALAGPRVAGVPAAVLRKEAAYRAAALGAYELHDAIDFGPWLHGALLPELLDSRPHLRPLRRTAAGIVASNVARLSPGDRPAVYGALVTLLAEDDACLKARRARRGQRPTQRGLWALGCFGGAGGGLSLACARSTHKQPAAASDLSTKPQTPSSSPCYTHTHKTPRAAGGGRRAAGRRGRLVLRG